MKTLSDIAISAWEDAEDAGEGDYGRLWEAAAQAVRREVIEECAKVCDTEWNGDSDTYDYSQACNECAESIRALKDKK